MFLDRVVGTDPRFRTVEFRPGLNLLVSERTAVSEQGDSRNGTGKTSLTHILRFVLGGRRNGALTASDVRDHGYAVYFGEAPGVSAAVPARVERSVPGGNLSAAGFGVELSSVADWQQWQAEYWFGISEEQHGVSVPQLWSHLVRTDFTSEIKSNRNEPVSTTSLKLGHFLGLNPAVLQLGADLAEKKKARKALKQAMEKGDIPGLPREPAQLRADLVRARSLRDTADSRLRRYRVDEQYAQHQARADELSSAIQSDNERIIVLRAHLRSLQRAIAEAHLDATDGELSARLAAAYRDQGLALPDLALKRFEDVTAFHESIVQNRKHRLTEEHNAAADEVRETEQRLVGLDAERAEVLRLLSETQALDTYKEALRSLTALTEKVMHLEERLTVAEQLATTSSALAAEAAAARRDLESNLLSSDALPSALANYDAFLREIYSDRGGDLLVESDSNGVLKVRATIHGDGSQGIHSVKTFVLDTVLLLSAMASGRAPRLLVHDSQLFDAMDDRQVASCLNIGARLAQEYDYQYVVTMNSDRLRGVADEGAFDPEEYIIEPRLTDREETGGLFGFRFH